MKQLQHEIKTERYRLHSQAMDISATSFHLQQYLRYIRNSFDSMSPHPTNNIDRKAVPSMDEYLAKYMHETSDDKISPLQPSYLTKTWQQSRQDLEGNKDSKISTTGVMINAADGSRYSYVMRELDAIHHITSSIAQRLDPENLIVGTENPCDPIASSNDIPENPQNKVRDAATAWIYPQISTQSPDSVEGDVIGSHRMDRMDSIEKDRSQTVGSETVLSHANSLKDYALSDDMPLDRHGDRKESIMPHDYGFHAIQSSIRMTESKAQAIRDLALKYS